MIKTTYQTPEIRDANDNIIQQGAFGKNTALANATNDGWIDYVTNDLEFLYDLAKDEIVPVPSLPASGQMNKTYLLTTTGVSYRWSGTQWVAVSSSEAVGRAESAASLAEQWATKTDGTVDGTEYSAKYYAGLAEASADDAQDTADDMATHLVQIDKNTGGVAKNSKRISNIEKLLQGNLYDYDTDDDVAYIKTVPSGALPYAGIEKLGGKTVVWNQLVDTSATLYDGGVTHSVADGVYTVASLRDASAQKYLRFVEASKLIQNHVYLGVADILADNSDYYVYVQLTTNSGNSALSDETSLRATDTANYVRSYTLGRLTNTTTGFAVRLANTAPQGNGGKVKNVQLFDLTLMFGAGSEPSTVAEFEAMFPADYYPYNAGTLLSAGVTEVKSVSKNLLNMKLFADTYPSYCSWSNNTLSANLVNLLYTQGITVDIPANSVATATINNGTATSVRIRFVYDDGTFIEMGSTDTSKLLTKRVVSIRLNWSGLGQCTISNAQIEIGAVPTAFSPYGTIDSLSIPAEVRALEGYGWSAGTAYNYIDFERKVFVKNVGRVDLGTLTWIYNNNVYGQYFSTTMNTKKDGLAGFVCAKYETFGGGVSSITSSTGIAQSESQLNSVYIVDPAYTNASAFKSAMSGVYAYYQLATPIETDISQYLTDNLIEVGAGGTLTFENSNGDDYHIPVPSTETYMIDLQEAISNG